MPVLLSLDGDDSQQRLCVYGTVDHVWKAYGVCWYAHALRVGQNNARGVVQWQAVSWKMVI